jgi:hypothetical protein
MNEASSSSMLLNPPPAAQPVGHNRNLLTAGKILIGIASAVLITGIALTIFIGIPQSFIGVATLAGVAVCADVLTSVGLIVMLSGIVCLAASIGSKG